MHSEEEKKENEQKETETQEAMIQETDAHALCEEYKAGWQRALADYQNLQKQVAEEKKQWMDLSKITIIIPFIEVYDHLKAAAAHEPTAEGAIQIWIEGVGHIRRQFADVLKQLGVAEIETVGKMVDAHLHESVGEEEKEGVTSGTIIKEVAGGYQLNGRVIKPAKVIVVK